VPTFPENAKDPLDRMISSEKSAFRNHALGPAEPIPLTVLTGFLGAGKTSLLNRLITDPALAETAVIVNEFGEIGLDHLLVKPVSEGVVLLQSGCLCCTLRG
jgi:Ni2+-binding GTPase involved in maturation of urease and hydrogenase